MIERDRGESQGDCEMRQDILAHSRQVYHFCCHLTGNRMGGEDLFQDTFLTAWEKREMLRNQVADDQMKNYLLGIAAHHWKNHQRKWFRRNRIAPLDFNEDAIVGAVSRDEGPEGRLLQEEMRREGSLRNLSCGSLWISGRSRESVCWGMIFILIKIEK